MCLMDLTKELARSYKKYKDEGRDYMIDDEMMKIIAEGAYVSQGGSFLDDDIEESSKPYFDYLKYGNKPQQQEEIKEQPIMIEDNNYNYEDNYETPYSFEYEPYLLDNNNYSITFDHEVDRSNSIQMIEELYNEEPVEEVDSNEIINVLSFLTNKVKEVKKCIIHYISNYRPIMNQYTHTIEAILIE